MKIIGREVRVIVDRQMGSYHPKHKNLFYPINYGYIEGVFANDNEEQDAYVLGVSTPLKFFDGVVIAIIKRLNDVEDKWVVAPKNTFFTKEQILEKVSFQEKFFKIEIITE